MIGWTERIRIAEWGPAEYRDIFASLACGTNDDGPELERLEARLRSIYGGRPLLLLNRARHGLELALRSFAERHPLRTEVVYPGYICRSVIETIERCGLTPVAADASDDLNIDLDDARSRLTSRTLAVVAAHMYACPADIEGFEELCRRHGIFLIDDAAQVVGVDVGGRPLGTFGACGLVSFSQSKTIVAGDRNAGGILIVNDADLENAVRRARERLSRAHYGFADFVRFLRDDRFDAYTSALTYYASELRRRVTGVEERRQPSIAAAMPNVSAAIALRQLDSLAARVAGRTRVLASFNRELTARGSIGMPQYKPGRHLTRVLTLLPDGVDMPSVRRELARRRIQTRRAYEVDPRYAGHLRRAPQLGRRLLEVPSHSGMADASIAWICGTLVQSTSGRAGARSLNSSTVAGA